MGETVRLKVSPDVAHFVRPDVASAERLAGIHSAAALSPHDRVVLLYCLMRDTDPLIKEHAIAAFSLLPEEILLEYGAEQEPHPAVLDAIIHIHNDKEPLLLFLSESEFLLSQTREFLASRFPSPPLEPDDTTEPPAPLEEGELPEASGEDVVPQEEPEEELYLSKFKMAAIMGIGEKIKMALTGDKEWRSILIKDPNKLVSGGVLKNPRITDAEVLNVLKAGVQNDEIMRIICSNKEWVKNYTIRKALVDSPRCPPQNALRYLTTMNEKDLSHYAKSKNVSSVVSTMAKRMLLAKKK